MKSPASPFRPSTHSPKFHAACMPIGTASPRVAIAAMPKRSDPTPAPTRACVQGQPPIRCSSANAAATSTWAAPTPKFRSKRRSGYPRNASSSLPASATYADSLTTAPPIPTPGVRDHRTSDATAATPAHNATRNRPARIPNANRGTLRGPGNAPTSPRPTPSHRTNSTVSANAESVVAIPRASSCRAPGGPGHEWRCYRQPGQAQPNMNNTVRPRVRHRLGSVSLTGWRICEECS